MNGESMCHVTDIYRCGNSLFIAKTLLILALAGSLLVHGSPFDRTVRPFLTGSIGSISVPGRTIPTSPSSLQNPPSYTLSKLPGNKLRLIMQDTDGPLFKKFRRYSDANIGGLVFSRRGENLLMTFQVAPGVGWRELNVDGISAITLDVGRSFTPNASPSLHCGPGKDLEWC